MSSFEIKVKCLKTYEVRTYDYPQLFIIEKGWDKYKTNRVIRGLYRELGNKAYGYEFNFVDKEFQAAFDTIKELRHELVTNKTELIAVNKGGGRSYDNGKDAAKQLGLDSGQLMRVARGFMNKINGYAVIPHNKETSRRLKLIVDLSKLFGMNSFTPTSIKNTKTSLRTMLRKVNRANWLQPDKRNKLIKGIESALRKGVNNRHIDACNRTKEFYKERTEKLKSTLDLKRVYTHASFHIHKGGEYLGVFPTVTDASKELGIEKSVIDRAVLGMTQIPGYTFRLLTLEEKFSFVTKRGYYPKPPTADIDPEDVLVGHKVRIK